VRLLARPDVLSSSFAMCARSFQVAFVIGTRPEAIKLFPLVHALAREADFRPLVILTAQHRDMLDQVMDIAGIAADVDLDLMRPGQSLTDVTVAALAALTPVFERLRPDAVVVQGDTTTAFVGALAAFYAKLPVVHVEAGLRSGRKYSPFPEEINRCLVDAMTDVFLPPTEGAKANLLKEGYAAEAIHVTGNTVVDALLWIRGRLECDAALRAAIDAGLPPPVAGRRLVLVTSHRRENFDAGIASICDGLKRLAARGDVQIVFPVHPNPNVRGPVHQALGAVDAIALVPPLNYLQFVSLMTRASLIITDSGGVQEEAPALGIPVLVMRDTTERPEGVAAGTAKLVGADGDRIVAAANALLDDAAAYRAMAQAHNPFGDGQAARRITTILRDFLAARTLAEGVR
jgi:UDP-N-acetylglucosamine 2-epimerase (non-hydrolysing)